MIGVFVLLCLLFSLVGSSPLGARESTTASQYKFLIVTPVEFQEEIQRLADHKNSVGMETTVINLDEIQEHQACGPGRDLAEKIKLYIKFSIEQYNISYVLLAGGKIGQRNDWYMPVRYVHMDNGWETEYISDLYFADIYDSQGGFSSWDADDDGIYSEWVEGNYPIDSHIDLYPDIAVGRIPARNIRELSDVIDKIIVYETTTAGQDWFNTMVAIAGDTYPVSHNLLWVGNEGEIYADQALAYMNEFTPVRMYLSENGFSGPDDVIRVLDDGCGFLYFVGHGNPRSWGNHPPDNETFVNGLQNPDMDRLGNQNKFPVCVVSGCHNCQFDVGILDIIEGIREHGLSYFSLRGGHFWRSEWSPECWGWKLLRLQTTGSIVTYGASALGHTKEDKSSFEGGINELEVEMFKQYGVHGEIHAGDLLKNAQSWYLDQYPIDWDSEHLPTLLDTWVDVQVVQSYVMFGDPSLRIGGY